MTPPRHRDQIAQSIVREVLEGAQDIEDSELFVQELLSILKRHLGFETVFAGGPAFGRALVSDEESEQSRAPVLETLTNASSRYSATMDRVFARVIKHGRCLDTDIYASESAKKNSPYYNEIMKPSQVSSLACFGLKWRRQPLLFISASRHDGSLFGERELDIFSLVTPALEAALLANLESRESPAQAKLTAREREICGMIVRGLSNREIGGILGSSPYTVRNQSVQIFRKLEVDNRVELTALLGERSFSGSCPELSVQRWLRNFGASCARSSA